MTKIEFQPLSYVRLRVNFPPNSQINLFTPVLYIFFSFLPLDNAQQLD